MFVSIMTPPRLALPMLSAMFLLALPGDPSPARTPGPVAPGQVMEVVAPAATVASTVHYQAHLGLTCSGNNCRGEFPSPGEKRRLNVTRMTCYLQATSGGMFHFGFIDLRRANNDFVLSQYLPVDHSSSTAFETRHTLNHAIDVQVGASQHIESR